MLGTGILNWTNARAYVSNPQSMWLWTISGEMPIAAFVFMSSQERLQVSQIVTEELL